MIQARSAEGQNAGRRVERQGGIMESRVVAPRVVDPWVRPQGWASEYISGLDPRVVEPKVKPQGYTSRLDPRASATDAALNEGQGTV